MRIKAPGQGRIGGLRKAYGFTLVELVVTLAVAAVLIAVAVPSFRHITISNRLTTSVNEVVNAVQIARMEAIKRNARTQLCSNSSSGNSSDALGDLCGTSAGAVVARASTTVVVVRESQLDLSGSLRLNGDLQALRFTAQGIAHATTSALPYSGQVIDICTPSFDKDNHRVLRMVAGSVLQTTTDSGECS
ncbi:GspH/FimT family pseudopilin [Dyella telluris]|uniref:Type II secretion system protein H n=1 Tax=Dyella telluris TaxID=2763498 RepID=A0A7G8Q632_9GAMM|nr:GspH/FimT family pseudopilin [Dyella telluris]QNK02240.1 GspH/FimT family pseudopilin [Dyella telluris]